jgi:hypothetical protein
VKLTEKDPKPFRLCYNDVAPTHLKVLKKHDLFLTEFNNNVYRAIYDPAQQHGLWYIYGIKVGTVEGLLSQLLERGINPDTLIEQ